MGVKNKKPAEPFALQRALEPVFCWLTQLHTAAVAPCAWWWWWWWCRVSMKVLTYVSYR